MEIYQRPSQKLYATNFMNRLPSCRTKTVHFWFNTQRCPREDRERGEESRQKDAKGQDRGGLLELQQQVSIRRDMKHKIRDTDSIR